MESKSQVKLSFCFTCNKTARDSLLCDKCIKDPFSIEKGRDKAAKNSALKIFKKFYSGKYPSIRNVNSQAFWDQHFEEELILRQQDEMTRNKIKKLTSFLPKKKINVLDLGFGQGYFEESILDIKGNINVYGIDISKNAVKRARKRFEGNFFHGNLLHLNNIFKKTFDVIVAIEVVEHISPVDIFTLFTNVNRLLAPDGLFILSTPLNEHLQGKKENPSGHVRCYTIDILKTELELSDFKVTDIHTFYAFNKFYKVKNLLAKIFPNRWEPNNVVMRAVKVR